MDWIFSTIAKEAVRSLLERTKTPDHLTGLRDAANLWALQLPEALSIARDLARSIPEQVLSHGGKETTRLSQEYLAFRIPSAALWTDALVEWWADRRRYLELEAAKAGLQPQEVATSFFLMPQTEARTYFALLGESLARTLAQSERFVRTEMFAGVQHLIEQQRFTTREGVAHSAAASPDPVPPTSSSVVVPTKLEDVGRDIDFACDLIKKGDAKGAIELLSHIRRTKWPQLDSRSRYRTLANIGNAELALGRLQEASQNYLLAVEFQPEDAAARANEALSFLLVGDLKTANLKAKSLLETAPQNARALMIWIRTSPATTDYNLLKESVPAPLRSDPEIARALSERAIQVGNTLEAEAILRAAINRAEPWAPLMLTLANLILEPELQAVAEAKPPKTNRIIEASTLATRVIQAVQVWDQENLEVQALLVRMACHRLLNQDAQAESDLKEARNLAPKDERVAIVYAEHLLSSAEDLEGAIAVLQGALPFEPAGLGTQFLASLLYRRGLGADKKEALDLLTGGLDSLGLRPEGEREEYLRLLVDYTLAGGQLDAAAQLVEEPVPNLVSPPVAHALRSRLLVHEGSITSAKEEALKALDGLSVPEAKAHTRRIVAIALERAGLFEKALEIWKALVGHAPDAQDFDVLLRCARRAGDDSYVLETCRRVRQSGGHTGLTLPHEIEVLLKYSEFELAREILEEYLSSHPSDAVARLHLCSIAAEQGWIQLAKSNVQKIPQTLALSSPEFGAELASVLAGIDSRLEALNLAYRLWKRFPANEISSRALVTALMGPGLRQVELPPPERVDVGVAVRFKELDSGEERWVVVENEEPASLAWSEYSPAHQLSRVLIGSCVGDEVVLPGGSLREKRGVVLEIRDKRVFRAQEIMSRWSERFPETRFFESIPVPSIAEGGTDFSQLLEALERASVPQEQLLERFRAKRLPISVFAHLAGKTVFETVEFAARNPATRVFASEGSRTKFLEATARISSAEEVVLSPTAIATLHILGRLDLLQLFGKRFVTSASAIEEMRALVRQLQDSRLQGYLGVDGGRISFRELSASDRNSRIAELDALVSALDKSCSILGGQALSLLPSPLRDQLGQLVSPATAESLAIAHVHSLPIWMDDALLPMVFGDSLRLASVSTQHAISGAQEAGLLSSSERSLLVAKLVQLGYDFTAISPQNILDVCEKASWDAEDVQVEAMLGDFSNSAWSEQTALEATKETLQLVWRSAPSELTASRITARVLLALGQSQDARGIASRVSSAPFPRLLLLPRREAALRAQLVAFSDGAILL